jgi:hypothetical protein
MTIATGSRWDIMGNHNLMSRSTGYAMVNSVGWYKPENVAKLTIANYPSDKTYEVRAHDSSEDTAAGVVHVVEIQVYEGLSYYVEVRQAPRVAAPALDSVSCGVALCTNNTHNILVDVGFDCRLSSCD